MLWNWKAAGLKELKMREMEKVEVMVPQNNTKAFPGPFQSREAHSKGKASSPVGFLPQAATHTLPNGPCGTKAVPTSFSTFYSTLLLLAASDH